MNRINKLLDKLKADINDTKDIDNDWFVEQALTTLDELKKQLTLTDVRFELPSDEIFKQGMVNLKNPLEEFYYYEAPNHSKWELTEFRESLKKSINVS